MVNIRAPLKLEVLNGYLTISSKLLPKELTVEYPDSTKARTAWEFLSKVNRDIYAVRESSPGNYDPKIYVYGDYYTAPQIVNKLVGLARSLGYPVTEYDKVSD